MAVHTVEPTSSDVREPVFGRTPALPASRFPLGEMRPDDAYQQLRDELLLDGNARQNLATFVQTWEEPNVHALMNLSIDKNMIDKDEYPQTAEIEARCVRMLADLWNAPAELHPVGTSTIGSSEACMLGGMAMKWRWREKMRRLGKPTNKPNIICGAVQVCWHKFARYWDVELREVPMAHGRYEMGPDEMLARVDENTIGVVPTFGVTYTGAYELVAPLADALDALQRTKGIDTDLHVDGASGGFLAPFCAPDVLFDFRLPRVKSISTSGHKFGLAPVGAGWVLWRDQSALPEDLIFRVNYLGGELPTFAINFSRPAGQVIAQYYNFIRLGHTGYREIQSASYAVAQYLAREIGTLGPFEFLCAGDPNRHIPAVTWRVREGAKTAYTLFDLSDRLRMRGWQVPAYTLTGTASDIAVCRILCRQGLSMDLANLLLDDLRRSIAHFDKHPVSVPMTEHESGGYKHS
jgi:glutamate decarboxylase